MTQRNTAFNNQKNLHFKENEELSFLDDWCIIKNKVITQQSPKPENVRRKINFTKGTTTARKVKILNNITKSTLNQTKQDESVRSLRDSNRSFKVNILYHKISHPRNCNVTRLDKPTIKRVMKPLKVSVKWLKKKSLHV